MSRKNLEMCSYKSVCVSHTDIHVNILEVIPLKILIYFVPKKYTLLFDRGSPIKGVLKQSHFYQYNL